MKFSWRISLKKKLFGFVGMASLLVLMVLGLGALAYSNIEMANFMKEDVHSIIEKALDIRVAEKTYLQFQTYALKTNFDNKITDIRAEITKIEKKKINKEWKTKLSSIDSKVKAYRILLEKLIKIQKEQKVLKSEMLVPIATSEKLLTDMLYAIQDKQGEMQSKGEIFSQEDIDILNMITDFRIALLKLQSLQLQYISSGDEKFIQQYKELSAEATERYLGRLEHYASISENALFAQNVDTIKNALGQFVQSIGVSSKFYAKEIEHTKLINDAGTGIIETADSLLKKVGETVSDQKRWTVMNVLGIALAGLTFFWALSYFLVRSITGPIGSVIRGLIDSAELVDFSSGQTATASQNLAERTSAQAAAIEEASSSLEEISSIAKNNAENTNHVDLLMKEAKVIADSANESMENLRSSMEGIARSGEETSKIVKTIDEIAFQTNLLALNAAVEAARAGEAGAGFAVVADEVRNLAMRAAEAAKTTAQLIEKTIKSVKTGVDMTEKNVKSFSKQAGISEKVGGLIGEIAVASRQQFEGVDQVNKTVRDMDTAVQENAAGAEQSSAASREMSAQSQQLSVYVNELVKVLEGKEKHVEKAASIDPSAALVSLDEKFLLPSSV